MADVTITQLPSATTPLSGTELVPIVQQGQTRNVSVSNILATPGASFSGVTFINGTIQNSTLTGTISAQGATVLGGTWSGGTISGATLIGVTTSGETQSGGTLTNVTIINSTLSGTMTATNAVINGGVISGAVINPSTFSGGTFTGNISVSATLINGTYSGGTWINGTISGATLSGVSLSLSGTTITNATLTGTTSVSGTVIQTGATISGGTYVGPTISGGSISGITDLAVADGGTGASTAAGARSNLSAAALGANTDITSLSGLTGAVATPNHIDFDVTPTSGGAVGRLIWNSTDGTLNLGMIGGNVTQQVGQEAYVYGRNNTGSTLLNGKVARLTGSIGTRATIALANSGDAENTIGILTEDITNNSEGLVTTFGLVRDLDTSALTEGSPVFLSNATSGELTTTSPTGVGAIVVHIGLCVRSHPTQGAILVTTPHTEAAVGNLTDVSISGIANYNLLQYNSASSYWKNVSGPAGAVVGTTDTQTLTNKTISGGTFTGLISVSGTLINGTYSGGTILDGTISGSTLTSTFAAGGATISGATLNNPTLTGTVTADGFVKYANSGTFSAAQRGTYSSVTATSGTVTLDFGNYQNFTVTGTGNLTFTGPSGVTSGQGGCIYVYWQTSGTATWAYNSKFRWPAATVPTATGTSGSLDVVAYMVSASGDINTNALLAMG